MIRLQEDIGNRILASRDNFVILLGEVLWPLLQSKNVVVSVLHMNIVVGWDSYLIVRHIYFFWFLVLF